METTVNSDSNRYPRSAPGFRLKSQLVAARIVRPAITHLEALESESIHILREVAEECPNPALLFSGGKDSVVVLRLAEKAFRPARFPFPLLHIDTGHNFPEVIAFRGQESGRVRRASYRALGGRLYQTGKSDPQISQ